VGASELVEFYEAIKKEHPHFYSPAIGLPFGQFTRLNDVPGGVYAEMWAEVHWTKRAHEFIANEEYRYISPEFSLNYNSEKTDNRIGAALLAIGATNRPFLCGMAPLEVTEEDRVSHIQVFMTGTWYHPWWGRIDITVEHLNEMVNNFEHVLSSANPNSDHPPTEMMVDYNHGSLYENAYAALSAGWVRGEGIYVKIPDEKPEVAAAAEPTKPHKTFSIPKADAEHDPPSQPTPSQGEHTMNDARIREILGLSQDVEVTDEHRTQAFSKLDEENQRLNSPETVQAHAQQYIAAHAAEVEIEGVVLVPQSEYDELTATQTPDPDTVQLSRDEHVQLTANAQKGAEAAQQLHQMRVDQVLKVNRHKFTAAEEADLREQANENFERFERQLNARAAIVQTDELGDDTDPETTSTDQVQQFLDQRIEELESQGKSAREAHSQSHREARKTFGSAYEDWRYRGAA
jgi:hypothetical protein